ncbi:unnamed protein product [Penicillium salamii]|uniref:Uncharacterized protein n=1 Tax=Penicillium salamii TaxID=1612424 RepID=A0A9W4JSE1_9EURO|nr:unnamed protein product [Penicillium salamii]CAG8015231.1 unnamed protein product [Penicillium salamii]CAG8015492.1 unnamed protein product [Penicillium salamii]CAG8057526.1 unnamed protein product [Penicillium salamii]CAG8183463.1 unnamed protein product [Penicillium salamii]
MLIFSGPPTLHDSDPPRQRSSTTAILHDSDPPRQRSSIMILHNGDPQ